MNKRILSILLCLTLVFTMSVSAMPAFAAGVSTTLTLTPDKTNANPGDTIKYTLTLGPVTNLDSIELNLVFPEGLTFVEESSEIPSALKEAMNIDTAEYTESTGVLLLGPRLSTPGYESASETVLLTFECEVDDDAEVGDYTVSIDPDSVVIFEKNDDMDDIAFTITDATVNVELPHICAENLTKVDADEKSCTESGNIAYWECSCGKYYADDAAVTEIVDKDSVIIPAGHEYGELVAAQEEVHTKDELKAAVAAYYFCGVCETYFDADQNETTLALLTGEMPSHDFNGEWVSQGEAGHAHVCTCGKVDTVHDHESDAPATEESAEVCKHCGFEMSPVLEHVHVYNQENIEAEGALVSKATCTAAAVYKKSCKCGEVSPNASDIFNYGDVDSTAHAYGELVAAQEEVHTKDVLKGAVAAHYFCDVCETYFDADQNETTLAALTSPAPEHEFDAWVSTDAENHWKKCECGLEDVEHAEEHAAQADDNNCESAVNCVCGKEMVAAKTHNFSGTLLYSEAGHWYACQNGGCEVEEDEPTPHAALADDHNCMTATECACGYEMAPAKAAHNFSGELKHDAEGHWYVCQNDTCTVAGPKADHEAQADDGDCTTAIKCECGEIAVDGAESHDLVWNSDAENHWKECQREGCEAAEEAVAHTAQDDGNCKTAVICECGRTIVTAASAHSYYNAIWSYDENSHWHVCVNGSCVAKDAEIRHSGEDDGDCTTAVVCECGREVKAAAADHDMVWNYDGENHWKECQNEGCEAAEEAVKHTAQDDNNCATAVVCECGKELKAAAAHDFSGEWQKNEDGHWYVCQNDDCLVKDTVVSHTCEDDNNCLTPVECDVCKYIVVDNAPAHDFSGEWQKDDEGHFHVCLNDGCVAEDETIPHSGEDDGDCETAVVCVCGHEVTAAKEAHDFTGEWHKNEGGHWHECLNAGCTVADNEVPHSGEDDGDCTTAVVCVCGEEVTAAKEAHDYTGEWKKDANGHWHECLTDGCKAKETVAKHENGNDDICDICGYDSTSYIPRPPYTPPTPPAPPVVDPEVPTEPETPAVDENAELKASVDKIELVARSSMSKAEGKKAVKLRWFDKNGSDLKFMDGFQVFRSTKRYSGFGKKPFFTTTRTVYWNTAIEDGMKYYYKVRGFVEIGDEKYFTEWSKKAWRTVK